MREYDFHMNIIRQNTDQAEIEYRQWKKAFTFLEDHIRSAEPGFRFATDYDLGNNKTLSVLFHKNELWIGVKNTQTNKFYHAVSFESIKKVSISVITDLDHLVKKAVWGQNIITSKSLQDTWGQRIALVRKYEAANSLCARPDITYQNLELPRPNITVQQAKAMFSEGTGGDLTQKKDDDHKGDMKNL